VIAGVVIALVYKSAVPARRAVGVQ
jgi:hypothetical protein